MQDLVKLIVRPGRGIEDAYFLLLAAFVGGAAGVLLAYKVSLWVGLPFALGATLMLYFTWRTPSLVPLHSKRPTPGEP